MFKIKSVWTDMKVNRSFVITATIIFVISLFMGMSNNNLHSFLESQLNAIGEIGELINDSSNPTLLMFLFIFFNNAIKCVMVVFLGAFFGLYPIFFLVINGLVLGYVIELAAAGQMRAGVFEVIFKLLLPHGIIEIPVLIIVGAYGLRLGKLLFSTLGALITGGNKLDAIGKLYIETLKRCGVITLYATILLLVASIIESTLTMWLASTIN